MIGKHLAIMTALLLASGTATVQAQNAYPSQVIRLIVPFPPGSSSDISARAVAQKISVPLAQQVIIENRPGAGGRTAMEVVKHSKPDGYTLIVGTVSSTVVPQLIYKNVPFDLATDFVPIATMANTPLLLTVSYDSPFATVADLVEGAKKAPRTLTYGNSSGLYRIAMEAFNDAAGVDLLGIPFKGPPAAAVELLAGRLSVNPDALGAVAPMLQAKRMRALAVMGSQRAESLPDVPTMMELGYKDFDFNGWLGILAPAGTPQSIVRRLHQEIAEAVQTADIRNHYRNLGMEPTVLSPEAYRNVMVSDLARYGRAVAKAGITKE